MRRYLALFLLVIPLVAGAQDFGFLQQNFWTNPAEFFDGDAVRLYTAIFNGGEADVAGVVGFFDNSQKIEEVDFSLAGGGRLQDVWADWLATSGEHILSAKIVRATATYKDGRVEELDLVDQVSGGIVRQIDFDTDKDGVGDSQDEDDDGDGLTDVREAELGTDSLSADTDGDGISDKEDSSPLTFNLTNNLTQQSSEETKGVSVNAGLAQVVSTDALNFLEDFRTTQAVGLNDKKVELKKALADRESEVLSQQSAVAEEKKARISSVNEAVGQEVLRRTNENTGLPDLAPSRILKMVYLGIVYLGLFIFENKLVFYSLLALIILEFLLIIFRRIFRRG